MSELYVFCEGATEQGFCAKVLQPHLFLQGGSQVRTIRTATSKHHGIVSRGGIVKYSALRRDISNQIKMRRARDVAFTTMIDLYGLPKDFPGKAIYNRDPVNPTPYVQALEQEFESDIGDDRFIAYLQLHEYETLLFADPDAMVPSFEKCDSAVESMKAIVAKFAGVEHINDGENTAPSKRIIKLLPAYLGRKASVGPQIAERIGIPVLRQKCPHFDSWVTRLEQWLAVQP